MPSSLMPTVPGKMTKLLHSQLKGLEFRLLWLSANCCGTLIRPFLGLGAGTHAATSRTDRNQGTEKISTQAFGRKQGLSWLESSGVWWKVAKARCMVLQYNRGKAALSMAQGHKAIPLSTICHQPQHLVPVPSSALSLSLCGL